MHKRGLCRHAVSVCLSVFMCVCVSVTFVNSVKTNKYIIKFFSPSSSHTTFQFICAKRHSNTPTKASNAGAIGRSRDSEPISGFFIACC